MKGLAAHSLIFRVSSSSNTPCSTTIEAVGNMISVRLLGLCWELVHGQPGPIALELLWPEILLYVCIQKCILPFSQIMRTPCRKKMVRFSLPYVSWQLTIPSDSQCHSKKGFARKFFFMLHFLVKTQPLPILGVIGSILPFYPLLFTKEVGKNGREKPLLLGFPMTLQASLQMEEVLKDPHSSG